MYNTNQKERYIAKRKEEVILPMLFLERLFGKTEPIEQDKNKDIADFSISEILDFYKMLNTKSCDVLVNVNTQLADYGRWMINENLTYTGINNFEEITIDMLNTCVNKLMLNESIMSEIYIHDLCNRFRNPRESFVVLMLYETGKTKGHKSIFEAKISDFDNGYLNTADGRRVKVSHLLYDVAMDAAKENTYYGYGSEKGRGLERKLKDEGYIYKDLTDAVNPDRKNQRLVTSMRTAMESVSLNKWVKMNSFAESGIVNHIKKLMKENSIDNPKNFFCNRELFDAVQYQHNIRIQPSMFIRKYGEYLIE